jgi:UDP-N-acetylglucosamine 2-epimerase (non-hydrolysing)
MWSSSKVTRQRRWRERWRHFTSKYQWPTSRPGCAQATSHRRFPKITGNTIVDALELLMPAIQSVTSPVDVSDDRKIVLVTAHRRENLGRPLRSICDAIRRLARSYQELEFAFIKHPNPVAARIVHEKLAERKRIAVLPPLSYLALLKLLSAAWLVLTDSGGIQEEAPSFGKPVLVLRDHTERVEGITVGCAKLIGTQSTHIISAVADLLHSPQAYEKLIPDDNPYGDGQASQRIVESIRSFVRLPSSRVAA